MMFTLLINKAMAICEDQNCYEEICCPQGGDCCWTNDPLMFHSIWIVPIIVFLLFIFPISQRMVLNAVKNKTTTKKAQTKAQILGAIFAILSLVGLHLGVHNCIWPKGSYNPIAPQVVPSSNAEMIQPPTDLEKMIVGVQPPFETATISVKDLAVPEYPITCYDWKLTKKPEGSGLASHTSQEETFDITPDVFGDYEGTVTLKNAYGLEGTAEFVVRAIPKQKLWIEMNWQHANDDMDLHLIRDVEEYNKKLKRARTKEKVIELLLKYHCFFGNCTPATKDKNPNWGSAGSDDDPKLDLDDKPNRGPENINILEPENIDYLIQIHDHVSHKYEGSNDVTIRVFYNKEKVWEGVRTISGEDKYVDVLTINGQTGKILEK